MVLLGSRHAHRGELMNAAYKPPQLFGLPTTAGQNRACDLYLYQFFFVFSSYLFLDAIAWVSGSVSQWVSNVFRFSCQFSHYWQFLALYTYSTLYTYLTTWAACLPYILLALSTYSTLPNYQSYLPTFLPEVPTYLLWSTSRYFEVLLGTSCSIYLFYPT